MCIHTNKNTFPPPLLTTQKYPLFYKGFNLCNGNEGLFSQLKRHENLFDSHLLKQTFIHFSETAFIFDLQAQRELKNYFTVTNVSEDYSFRIMLLINSKEYKVNFDDFELGPAEERVIEVTFVSSG